jgi:pantetheine-phosphate adenylyltransferase
MITEVVAKFPNVTVDSWSGLLVDYRKSNSIQAIVKGLRAVSDFDYELQMAQVNLQGIGSRNHVYGNSPDTLLPFFIISKRAGPLQRRCLNNGPTIN